MTRPATPARLRASWVGALPAQIRWTVALALVGLAVTVPFSAPDGTGMQWDELVLTAVGASAAWMLFGRLRAMDREAARPWWAPAIGTAMFALAQLLAGAFPGPEFDGFGADDVLLFLGATSPLITCGMLARRVSRTRWLALLVDGAVITVSLLVVTEVLRAPLVNPVGAPDDLRSLVLAYGAYAAVMVGGVGALCTVSTAALRRSATTLIASVGCQAAAAGAEAMAIVAPSPAWTAVSDLAVATALVASALAALHAPAHFQGRGARATAPVVSPIGIMLVVGAMLSLPLSIALMELRGLDHSLAAEFGIATVFGLMALRLALRIREDGQVSEDLVRTEEDFRELVESSSDGIAIVDDDLHLLFTSPAARRLLGLSGDADDVDLLGLLVPEDRALVRAGLARTGTGELHFRVQHEDGARSELEAASSDRPGGGRRVLYLRDVTTRRRRERELERMAYTDHLTALGNRAQLFEEMAVPSDESRCLLVLDMDGFKAVNDVAGHESGDQLLVEVARRLHTVVREDDLVTRLGGDEFAVLVVGAMDDGEEVAQRVVDALALPYRTGEYAFAIGASVGVATLGAAGGQFAFRQADAALRAAKAAGKGCVRVAEGTEVISSVTALVDLETLTADGRLRLRLDPALDRDGRIDLVHALPVFEHPEHGAVGGQELWAGAERYGVSARLQSWLLREASTAAARLGDVSVAVSLPAGHVTADGLADDLAATLAATGLAPSRLILSFTEETLLTAPAALVPELEAARATGVRLCLDNFGMGHSLYAVLARVPLDLVRVDVTALAGRDDLDRALQVLAAIVHSATSFDMTVIAGGIGGPDTLRAATEAGVALLHGRHLPHDLTVDGVAALLAAQSVPTA